MAIKKRKPAKKATTRKTTAKRKPAARKTTAKRKPAAKKTTAKRKPAAKKTTAKRKTTARKTVKKAAPKRNVKVTAVRDPFSKTFLMRHLAEATELSKKEVELVFEELSFVMERHLKKGAAGQFTVPGLMKCVVKRIPAKKARKGINPFTGEEMMFKAKPARNVVKVRPLKKLKEMV